MKSPAAFLLAAVLLVTLFASGYATIARGTKDTLVVESEPAGLAAGVKSINRSSRSPRAGT